MELNIFLNKSANVKYLLEKAFAKDASTYTCIHKAQLCFFCNKPQRTQMFIAEGETPRDYEN